MCKIEVKVIPAYSNPLTKFDELFSNLMNKMNITSDNIKITEVRKGNKIYHLEFSESEKNAYSKEIINYFNKLEGFCAEEKF